MWFESVTDLAEQTERLRVRRYGVIEVVEGRLRAVRLRPFPKLVSLADAALLGRWFHRHRRGDRCLLYYNQLRRFPNFLALTYLWSARETRLGTVLAALAVLDEVARLKRSDALLCDAGNARLSQRLLARYGWQPHCPSRWHRNFIKRLDHYAESR